MSVDRVDQFEADIAASPEAFAALLDRWVGPDLGGRRRFLFTGLGSSRFAALVVGARLAAAGHGVWVEHASTTAPVPPAEDLVVVAVSASGRTPEVVAAARRHRGRSLVVGVTNGDDAPLAEAVDVVVPLRAGEESAGIASRSFRATMAALALLSGIVDVATLRPCVEAMTHGLVTRATWAPPMTDKLSGEPSIDILAPAPLIGLAEQAALMFREAPRLPAQATETADWLHTGVYLALPGHRVALYPGSPADEEVIASVERRGGAVIAVPPGMDGEPIARAIVDSLVAEEIASRLWGEASATDKDA